MKIGYVAWVPASGETGVLKKILFQMRAWRDMGHDVSLFVLGQAKEPWQGATDVPIRLHPTGGTLSWFVQAERLVTDVLRWDPDIVYHRFNVHFPALDRLLAVRPTVIELNTLDVDEYRRKMSKLRFAYHLLTRGRILRGARGIVAVTHEIAASVERFGRPMLVLGNGVDFRTIQPVPATTATKPRLLFIATRLDEPWHGYDKLMRLAAAFPEWQLDVIGAGPSPDTPTNVAMHGFLRQTEYQSILASADVGIGPLALHRKHMDEACPLKTREYLAAGLAVIAAHRDPDFVGSVPFLLELPNHQHNIENSLPALRAFVQQWHHRRVDRSLVEHLDTRSKEKARLDFFAGFARTHPR